MGKSKKAQYGQFNTGVDECIFTLNEISKYTEINGNILEPSFGTGNFVRELIKYNCNIDSFEVDKNVYKKIDGANTILGDFLFREFDKKYDLIIGNPPYIELSYSFYSEKEIETLKSLYEFKKRGRVNLIHFFMDKSFDLLKDDGIIGYLLPSTILTSPWYNDLREKIYNDYTILDIIEHIPFKNVSVNVCLLILKKKIDLTHKNIIESNGYYIMTKEKSVGKTLEDRGFKCSIGGILWYKNKEILSDNENGNKVLIYSNNIGVGDLFLNKKLKSKIEGKKQYITGSFNIISNCIIMPRVISKELKFYLIEDNSKYVFENHVMIITHKDLNDLKELYGILLSNELNFKEFFNSSNITVKEILNFKY